MTADVDRVGRLSREHGVNATWIGVFHNTRLPDLAIEQLDHALTINRSGMRTFPKISPRTVDIRVSWSGGMSFYTLGTTWHPMVQADAAGAVTDARPGAFGR